VAIADDDKQTQARNISRWMMSLTRNGDRSAFASLFDYFAPRLNSYLLRLGLERMAAEEITQEVMLTLWLKPGLFDPSKSSLSTWLFRIARNRRIDAARRERRGRIDENDLMLHPAATPMPDDILAEAARADHVRMVMADLPPDQINLLRLAFFDGLSHSQIADATGLPLGTVKSRIRLAFARLRHKLASRGIDRDA
jgi:RNA polymerase sigma-70 factor, ECF subfamily